MTSWLIMRVKHVLSRKKNEIKKDGLDGGSNSRPLAPTASVLPLDQLMFYYDDLKQAK